MPIPGRLLARPTLEDTIVSMAKPGETLVNQPDLGIGDIVYVVGLFHLLSGKNINLPVVHTGHIALLPGDEKIPVRNPGERKSHDVEAYLVEAHGLEGLSGAPVFARTSVPIMAQRRHEGPPLQGGHKLEFPVAGRLHSWTMLLGLWQASWDEWPSRILSKEKKLSKDQKVPLGMGVVVPAYKIAETLNRTELMMARRQRYQDELTERAATTDSLPSPSEASAPESDANPNHLADFTRLVDVAARKRPQDD